MDDLEKKWKGTLQVGWLSLDHCPGKWLNDDDWFKLYLLFRGGELLGKLNIEGGKPYYQFCDWADSILEKG